MEEAPRAGGRLLARSPLPPGRPPPPPSVQPQHGLLPSPPGTLLTSRTRSPTLKPPPAGYTPASAPGRFSCPWYPLRRLCAPGTLGRAALAPLVLFAGTPCAPGTPTARLSPRQSADGLWSVSAVPLVLLAGTLSTRPGLLLLLLLLLLLPPPPPPPPPLLRLPPPDSGRVSSAPLVPLRKGGRGVGGARARGRQKLGSRADFQ